jgi:iron(III) transport system permease protein
LVYLPLLLFLVPPYLHATAWISVGSAVEAGLAQIGLQMPEMPGALAVIWIQLAAVFPVAVGFALVGFRMTDPILTDAAHVFASDGAVFRRVEWPQMRPTVLIGWALTFLLSLADFSVPSLMQIDVFALEAFVEYSMAADAVAALIVAFPHLLIGLGILLLIAHPLRALALTPSYRVASGPFANRLVSSSVRIPGRFALVFALLQVTVPVIALGAAALPAENLARSIAENGQEIANSVITAGVSGAVSVVLALLVLPLLTTLPRLAIALIPLTIPAALAGIGAIRLWTLPGLESVYGTAAMPVLVAVAQFSPVAILALFVQTHRCDRAWIEVAQVFRGDGLETWQSIFLPVWAPGLWAGFFAVFGLTLTELTASLLVSPPGRQALTAKIYSLLHYGASERVAALCLVLLLISVAAAAGVFAALARRQTRIANGV